MDVLMLTQEEYEFVCHRIEGMALINYYTKNPKPFGKICPGQRPNTVSEERAINIAIKYRKDNFIADFISKTITQWLFEIETVVSGLVEEGATKHIALLKTLPDSKFDDQVNLYFKLLGQEYSEDYLELFESALQFSKTDIVEGEGADEHTPSESAKQKWEEAEQIYIQDIELLKDDVETKEAKLKELESSLKETREALLSAQKTQQKLDNKAVVSTVPLKKEAFPYRSLAVVETDYYDRKHLLRLADLEVDSFDSTYVETWPDNFKLYSNEYSEVGYVGVWDWRVEPREDDPTRGFVISEQQRDCVPIQIIWIERSSTIEALIEELQVGIVLENIHVSEKMLLAIRDQSLTYQGLYCEMSQVSVSGGKFHIKDVVLTLPLFRFNIGDVLKTSAGSYYSKLSLGTPEDLIAISDPLNMVKNILVERVTWASTRLAGFVKSDFQKIKAYLESFKTTELYSEVAKACDCSMADAEQYVNQFIEMAVDQLQGNDIEETVLARILLTNEELQKKCMQQLTETWEVENLERVAAAKKEEGEIERACNLQTQKLEGLQTEYETVEKRLKNMKAELAEKNAFIENVERNVADRMQRAKESTAEFVSEMLFQPTGVTSYSGTPLSQASVNLSQFVLEQGEVLPQEDQECITDWQQLLTSISVELEEAGVSSKQSHNLSAYLYAAYINKTPVLLLGTSGREIADALSSAMFGRKAGNLTLSGAFSATVTASCVESQDTVIVIENPFAHDWGHSMLKLIATPNKFFVLTVPYPEEIMLESHGILNYMLPVLTDVLIDKKASCSYLGAYMSTSFKHYTSVKNKHDKCGKLYNNFPMTPLAKILAKNVLEDMHSMLEIDGQSDFTPVALLPYVYILEQQSMLKEYLSKENLAMPLETRDAFEIYLGEL